MQVLLMSGHGATSVDPDDGKLLWEYPWARGIRIVQPALTSDGEVLISLGDEGGMGTAGLRRIAVAHGPGGWTVHERWTSTGLKPHFNDFVVHNGHAFGFDGAILACIDLKDGQRKWKGGRYGGGQLVLLPDQDLLLVLSEEGELALVGATADQFKELARFPAIEGKTWNHPVTGRRPSAGSKRPGDGRVPAVPRAPLTEASRVPRRRRERLSAPRRITPAMSQPIRPRLQIFSSIAPTLALILAALSVTRTFRKWKCLSGSISSSERWWQACSIVSKCKAHRARTPTFTSFLPGDKSGAFSARQ